MYARALRLGADSYDLRIPQDNLARPNVEASSVCMNRAPVCINKSFMHTHVMRSPPPGVEKLSGVFMNYY